MRTFDKDVQRALSELDGRLDLGPAPEIWAAALDAKWDGVDRWFHGDVAEGNLLLRDGRLAAVIDFGTCGVGDPACDLAVAWTLLTAEGRQAFRERLAVDDVTWARGRGWALWKMLAPGFYTYDASDGAAVYARSSHALREIFTEYESQKITPGWPCAEPAQVRRDRRDGHQIRRSSSSVSAGTSSERTTNASSRTPNATMKAICARNSKGSTASAENVAARTTPAEVMTPPVIESPRRVPACVPRFFDSSRTRVIRKML